MILCLDIGNSHMHGGVFDNDQLLIQFRMASKTGASSDEYGVFLRSVLRAVSYTHLTLPTIYSV